MRPIPKRAIAERLESSNLDKNLLHVVGLHELLQVMVPARGGVAGRRRGEVPGETVLAPVAVEEAVERDAPARDVADGFGPLLAEVSQQCAERFGLVVACDVGIDDANFFEGLRPILFGTGLAIRERVASAPRRPTPASLLAGALGSRSSPPKPARRGNRPGSGPTRRPPPAMRSINQHARRARNTKRRDQFVFVDPGSGCEGSFSMWAISSSKLASPLK